MISAFGGRYLESTIVEWYGGQEHGTRGWEKKEVDRLLADAASGKINAVIVAYPDRWSRDIGKSKEGLKVFRTHKVRFFIGASEQNLFDPTVNFVLGMHAEVGEYIASGARKKSIESRIERAREKGHPTGGKLPYGRTFDKATGTWGIDPVKKALVEEVAERYLKGEGIDRIALEKGMSHSHLSGILRDRCGTEWRQEFRSDELNIHEVVTTKVPALLDGKTIERLKARMKANRTYLHKPPVSKHDHLLRGLVFCAECGCSMFGQPPVTRCGKPYRYYRHGERPGTGAGKCTLRPRPRVRADRLEEAVLKELLTMFGNPSAVEKAVQAAVPDCDKELKRRAALQAELDEVTEGIDRVLAFVFKGKVSQDQADKQLKQANDRLDVLREELAKIDGRLADETTVKNLWMPGQYKFSVSQYSDDDEDSVFLGPEAWSYEAMSRGDRKALIDAVFGETLSDGTPAGVYVTPTGGDRYGVKSFAYEIKGRLSWVVKRQLPGRATATCWLCS
jgi:DNA invertase Pin-like site-specific DNA recombinase